MPLLALSLVSAQHLALYVCILSGFAPTFIFALQTSHLFRHSLLLVSSVFRFPFAPYFPAVLTADASFVHTKRESYALIFRFTTRYRPFLYFPQIRLSCPFAIWNVLDSFLFASSRLQRLWSATKGKRLILNLESRRNERITTEWFSMTFVFVVNNKYTRQTSVSPLIEVHFEFCDRTNKITRTMISVGFYQVERRIRNHRILMHDSIVRYDLYISLSFSLVPWICYWKSGIKKCPVTEILA